MLITSALKEWSVAVDALADGDTILLLRKGGIKEHKGRFAAEADRVLLFPTFEHQKPELLKPDYRDQVVPVEKGWHPQTITLKAWAEITHIFLTQDAQKVEALAPFHIWQPQLAQERLKWKVKQPLYVLTLRTYRLANPMTMPWQSAFGGCRSWLDLSGEIAEGVEIEDGTKPVLSTADYQAQVEAIAAILAG